MSRRVAPRYDLALADAETTALMPHLLVTAGNDQHLRIWDTRHFSHLNPRSTEVLTPAAKTEDGKPPRIDTYPSSSIGNEKVGNYLSSAKGKGLHRASFQHGKSCSAAYWDPWGRRILTTSYDDKLRSRWLSQFTLHCVLTLQYGPSTRTRSRKTRRFRLLTLSPPNRSRTTAKQAGGSRS